VLYAIARGAFGFGDVRLALILGALLGWFGLINIAYGLVLGIVVAGVSGVFVAVKHRTLHKTMAFGPPLMIGALLVVLAH